MIAKVVVIHATMPQYATWCKVERDGEYSQSFQGFYPKMLHKCRILSHF